MKSLDYLAGLFDGEGSFSIQVSLRKNTSFYCNPSMSVNLYYGTDVLQHFVDAFGGKIYPYRRQGQARGARWHVGRREPTLAAARALRPRLEIKRDIADRFIQALEMFPTSTGAARGLRQRNWTAEIAVAVARIALSLNPPRARKTNKTVEYVTILEQSLSSCTSTQRG